MIGILVSSSISKHIFASQVSNWNANQKSKLNSFSIVTRTSAPKNERTAQETTVTKIYFLIKSLLGICSLVDNRGVVRGQAVGSCWPSSVRLSLRVLVACLLFLLDHNTKNLRRWKEVSSKKELKNSENNNEKIKIKNTNLPIITSNFCATSRETVNYSITNLFIYDPMGIKYFNLSLRTQYFLKWIKLIFHCLPLSENFINTQLLMKS